jgi:hypothetical protein
MTCKKNAVLTVFRIFSLNEHRSRIQNAVLQIITEQLEKLPSCYVDLISLSQKIAAVLRPWILFLQAIYSLLLLCVNPELLMFKVTSSTFW